MYAMTMFSSPRCFFAAWRGVEEFRRTGAIVIMLTSDDLSARREAEVTGSLVRSLRVASRPARLVRPEWIRDSDFANGRRYGTLITRDRDQRRLSTSKWASVAARIAPDAAAISPSGNDTRVEPALYICIYRRRRVGAARWKRISGRAGLRADNSYFLVHWRLRLGPLECRAAAWSCRFESSTSSTSSTKRSHVRVALLSAAEMADAPCESSGFSLCVMFVVCDVRRPAWAAVDPSIERTETEVRNNGTAGEEFDGGGFSVSPICE